MRCVGSMLVGAVLTVASAAAVDPSSGTITIAPHVVMPLINNGAITNGSWFPNNTLETPGIEAWFGAGGRGVDTAWCYHNQPQVGVAVRNTSLPRESVFVTSKIPCMGTAELAFEYIQTDLKQLGLDYVDLLLIHAPGGGTLSDPGCGGPCKTAADRQATYKGLERALAAKMTRSIGVSNFKTEHIKEILAIAETPPAVNQCSMHIGGHDDETIKFCQAHGITYEAYSPLGGDDLGGKSVMTYPDVQKIARAHDVSAAQVALRWVLQQGCALTTATGNVEYMHEDLDTLSSFELSKVEMATLSAIHGPPPPAL